MAKNGALYARRAGLSLLKADAQLAAIVADRVYPPQRPASPVWPFIGWGVPIATGFDATCMDGSRIEFAVHAYGATSGTGAGTVAGEELAQAIADRAAAVLVDAGEVNLAGYGCPFPATAHFTWRQTDVTQDGAEADAFHAIAAMTAHVVS